MVPMGRGKDSLEILPLSRVLTRGEAERDRMLAYRCEISLRVLKGQLSLVLRITLGCEAPVAT